MENTVANQILEQLGGQKFIAMTGANRLTGTASGLTFHIGGGAQQGINTVRVELATNDTYTLTFYRIRGVHVEMKAEARDLYAENLREVFTAMTGMETSL